jgi:hypothetical protein
MSEVLIIRQTGNSLSKKQLEFNRLIRSLEKKRADLQELEARFKKMLAMQEEKLHPYKKEFAEYSFELVKLLDNHFENGKLKQRQKEKTAQFILNITGIMEVGENIEAVQAIASKYIAFQQKDMSDMEKMMGKEMLKNVFSSAFGVEMDDEDIDMANFSKMGEKLHSKMAEEMHGQRKENFTNTKHKSYNGQNKKLAEKAELLRKSWKMLYTQLVRKLHPDTEQDAEIRIEKTELLKKVTAAYEHSDFYTLLHLYQQEIGFSTDDEKNYKLANGEVLNDYIGILKKQDAELRDKIGAIRWEAENRNMGFITHENATILFDHFILQEQSHYTVQINNTKNDIETFADIGMYKKALGAIQMHQLRPNGDFSFVDEGMDDLDDIIFEDFFFEKKTRKKPKRK